MTPELQAVLGINVDQAWIVAARIEDPQMYEALKASRGDMSIQGMARRKVKQ